MPLAIKLEVDPGRVYTQVLTSSKIEDLVTATGVDVANPYLTEALDDSLLFSYG